MNYLSPYFERDDNFPYYNSVHDSIYSNTYMLGFICAIYLPTIFTLKNYMQKKPAMRGGNYDTLFFLWNMFLSLSSGLGAVLLFPLMYEEITINDNHGMCNNLHVSTNNPIFIYVCILFNFSKFLEFIDTVFVVTRKSQLEFIHWYHHIVTCLYCWHCSYVAISSGKFFALMNLSVHTVMYFYYALYALGNKMLYPYRKIITVIQTSQMVGGCYIVYNWFMNCQINSSKSEYANMVFAALMYFSYFIHFIKVFFREKIKYKSK
jgi:hypothetical protein